jgi:hypothetical protein
MNETATLPIRVINWNQARYNQEFNYQLAVDLLMEELHELFKAKNDVEILDAIGDICFVAIGVFWKAKVYPKTINFIWDNLCNTPNPKDLVWKCDHFNELFTTSSDYKKWNNSEKAACILALHCMYLVCANKIASMGIGLHKIADILEIICNSNDTKEIKGKTAAHIKANISKGEGYVAPTAALNNLLTIIRK